MEENVIVDLNQCNLSPRNGRYGGMAGSKEGIIYEGEYWIVKYPKNTKSMQVDNLSYTTSPLSEYIGSHVYEILGYDVHETFLGIRNNKIVVACKDFCDDKTELREVRVLKNIYNETLQEKLETDMSSTGESHSVNLNELLIHLDYNPVLSNVAGLKERFWECVVVDLFINNNDRNNGNWGLLYKDQEYSIAPVFDNGAAFSNKLSDERIENILCNPDKLMQSSLNISTAYAFNDKKLTFQSIMKLQNKDFENAIKKVVPIIKNKISEINEFINNIPESYKGNIICSDKRKEFYKAGLQLRLEKGLELGLEKIYKKEMNNLTIKDKIKKAQAEKADKLSSSKQKKITRDR